MRNNVLRNMVLLMIVAVFSSCYQTKILSYDLESLDNKGIASKQDMTIKYDKFDILYDVYGHCYVKNNSNKTMYIDLGESYVIKEGVAQRIYSNSIVTTSKSSSNGGAINLGAITGAFGLGGIAGQIAKGIHLGSENTNGYSIQTMEERYVSIPPQSSRKIKFANITTPENLPKRKGVYKYGKYDRHEHLLTYTFDSEGQDMEIVRNDLYINEVEISKSKLGNENSVNKRTWPKWKKVWTKTDVLGTVGMTWGTMAGFYGLVFLIGTLFQ